MSEQSPTPPVQQGSAAPQAKTPTNPWEVGWELLRILLGIRWVRLWVLPPLAIIATFGAGFYAYYYVIAPKVWPSRPVMGPSIASFPSELPRTNDGGEWEVFNDNKLRGLSSCWYETVPNPEVAGDYFLRVHYRLDPGSCPNISEAYAGIYASLNPPLGSVDLSHYSGVRFRARIVTDSTPSPRVVINLANPHVLDFAYHECDFGGQMRADGRFAPIEIPFTRFRSPVWATREARVAFDPADVYRITFVIKGVRSEGYFDFDDVELLER